jgi:putative spermidine/putrescine transport system substrate-binding protein
MQRSTPLRRGRVAVTAALAGAAALAASACGAPSANVGAAPTSVPNLPAKPIELTILDVSGDLAISQPIVDDYLKQHPNVVSKFNYLKAPATDVTGKIKAQQNAGQVNIDLVLTGGDGLSALRGQDMVVPLLPNYAAKFGDLQSRLDPGAWKLQQASGGFGVVDEYGQSGPLFQYAPDRVANPPRSPQELLDWAKAHPGRFLYANPNNSGPGRTFLMGLPYVLGDANPADPVHGWAKTWAYLRELNKYVAYYPSGTGETLKQLGDGSRDIVPTQVGIDIAYRVNGTLPANMGVFTWDDFHWVADAHYMVIPKGVPADHIGAVLDLMNWFLQPKEQALTYEKGFITFPPKGVTPDLATDKGKQIVQQYGRPDFYPKQFASHPVEAPLDSGAMQQAFDMWNRQIGSLGAGK